MSDSNEIINKAISNIPIGRIMMKSPSLTIHIVSLLLAIILFICLLENGDRRSAFQDVVLVITAIVAVCWVYRFFVEKSVYLAIVSAAVAVFILPFWWKRDSEQLEIIQWLLIIAIHALVSVRVWKEWKEIRFRIEQIINSNDD